MKKCNREDETECGKKARISNLLMAYPNVRIREDDALWDAFNRIVEFGEAEKFIFVLGEWDFMFLLKV